MTRKTLGHLARPYSTPELAQQALLAARRRRLQMIPGNAPETAPREDPVSHYQGPKEEIELGAEPLSQLEPRTIAKS